MSVKDIPEGFAVAEGKWHVLEACRYYSATYPDGTLMFSLNFREHRGDLSFPYQREAIKACRDLAKEEEDYHEWRYQHLLASSDTYPEWCTQYRDIIVQVTGLPPNITRFLRDVYVSAVGKHCRDCGVLVPNARASAPTIEEALAEVAEAVYANRCPCERLQDAPWLQMVA